MKEYKYTIDGKKYEVTIGDIADNVVSVTVNGEDYKVEMEPEKEPQATLKTARVSMQAMPLRHLCLALLSTFLSK